MRVDRLTLAKRRWRATADDGRELGFDLEVPLHDGDLVFIEGDVAYYIAQQPEPVLEVPLDDASPALAARYGWLLGNLHFPVEIAGGGLRTADDPAIRQMLAREEIAVVPCSRVFNPLRSGGHTHGH